MKRLLIAVVFVVAATAAFADPVPLFSIALNEVHARTSTSLTGYLIVTLAVRDCASQRDDSDLGPFIRMAEKNGDEGLVIFVAPNIKQTSYAVFFRGDHASAYTESTQRSELHRVSIEKPAARKQTSLKLEEVEIKADDGTPITALHIVEDK